MTQAKTGGEIGINGEYYKGGQFLPQSEQTIKGAYKPVIRKGSKKEVAPYVWEQCPADDMLSIYDRIGNWVTDNRKECQYKKGAGFVGFELVKLHDQPRNSVGNREFSEEEREWINGLIEAFNSGERWFPLEIDLWHYKK